MSPREKGIPTVSAYYWEAGADPNGKGDLSLSLNPLYCTIRSNQSPGSRQLLLDAGARVDEVNEIDCTDLESCSPDDHNPHPEIFRLMQSFWPGVKPGPAIEE